MLIVKLDYTIQQKKSLTVLFDWKSVYCLPNESFKYGLPTFWLIISHFQHYHLCLYYWVIRVVTISFASNISVHWLLSSIFKLFIWSDNCSLLSLTILFSQKKAWLYFLIENQSIVCLMSRSNIGCLRFDWSSHISNITTCVYITVYITILEISLLFANDLQWQYHWESVYYLPNESFKYRLPTFWLIIPHFQHYYLCLYYCIYCCINVIWWRSKIRFSI